jgi:hypothetical protein
MSPTACLDQIAGDGRPWGAGGGCFLRWRVVVRRRQLQGRWCAGGGGPEQETRGAQGPVLVACRRGRGRGGAGRRVPELARPWRAGYGEAVAVAMDRCCRQRRGGGPKERRQARAGDRCRRRSHRPASAEKAEVGGCVREAEKGENEQGLVDPCGRERGPRTRGGELGRAQPCPPAKLNSSFSTGQG